MSEIKIDPNFRPLQDFLIQFGEKINKACQETVLDAAAELARNLIIQQARPHDKSGQYTASINIAVEPERRIIGPRVAYAGFLERGTRPHIILPRSARVLAFDMNGQTVFARRVRHPGSAPRWIVAKATEEFRVKIGMTLNKIAAELIGGK